MYGSRGVRKRWAEAVCAFMIDDKIRVWRFQSVCLPTRKGVEGDIHGDGTVISGGRTALGIFKAASAQTFEVTQEVSLGRGVGYGMIEIIPSRAAS